MTTRILLRRNAFRVEGWEDALSAITAAGRDLGRPPVGTAMPARTGINSGLSPACPGVSLIASGRPAASTAACAVVVHPPRE